MIKEWDHWTKLANQSLRNVSVISWGTILTEEQDVRLTSAVRVECHKMELQRHQYISIHGSWATLFELQRFYRLKWRDDCDNWKA